jgi:hypothetical protein
VALRVFKTMRAGLESTRGTNLSPTRGIPFTNGAHDQDIELIYPEEMRNSYHANYAGDAGTETNSFEFDGPVGYNNLVWWLNLHVKAVASGTGAGADKTWTFLPTATLDDLKTATIQFGYTDGIGATRPAWEVGYCIGDELTLAWDKTPGSPGVTFRSRIISPEAATQVSAFTGVGTYTTETDGLAKAKNTAVTIDTTTIGTTTDNDILSVEWTLNDGSVNLYTLNNSANAQDTLRPNPWAWTARIRRYYRNDTEVDAYVAKTLRKVRVRTLGSVLGSSNFKIDLELYGKYQGPRRIVEVDGLGIEEYTLVPIFDATATTSFQLIVVNDQGTIT